MPTKPLNEKTVAVYDFIDRFIEEHGFPPTIRDVCVGMEFSSTNGGRYHLDRLESGGYIKRDAKISRAIELLRSPHDERPHAMTVERTRSMVADRPSLGIPIIGQVAAGSPIAR